MLPLFFPLQQLIQAADLLHQRVFDQLYFNNADTALDKLLTEIEYRRLTEEIAG